MNVGLPEYLVARSCYSWLLVVISPCCLPFVLQFSRCGTHEQEFSTVTGFNHGGCNVR